jgi:hypothetical protein
MSLFAKIMAGGSAPEPSPEETTVSSVSEETSDDLEEVALETDISIKDMSKEELEAYGRTVGIELDRRHSRKRLVQELEEYLADS